MFNASENLNANEKHSNKNLNTLPVAGNPILTLFSLELIVIKLG